jgi:hypothetical protein
MKLYYTINLRISRSDAICVLIDAKSVRGSGGFASFGKIVMGSYTLTFMVI